MQWEQQLFPTEKYSKYYEILSTRPYAILGGLISSNYSYESDIVQINVLYACLVFSHLHNLVVVSKCD